MSLAARARRDGSPWDLTALLNAADGLGGRAQRHLWLVRLMEWLRHAPRSAAADGGNGAATAPRIRRCCACATCSTCWRRTPSTSSACSGCSSTSGRDIRSAGLFSDFGFGPRMALYSEIWDRLRLRVLPTTPDTRELAELFPLLFKPEDAHWLAAIDEATLQRLGTPAWRGVRDGGPDGWREEMLDAMTYLVSAVRAAGFSGALRKRMSDETLADEPFRQLSASSERLREAVAAGDLDSPTLRREAGYLRVLLDQCRVAVDSIAQHLEEYGISVDIVYEVDQLRARVQRIEQLLDCVLSPAPARELLRLTLSLVQMLEQRRGVRSLLARHYAQLSRKVAERSAETGEHYIAHTRDEYRDMLRRAAGGGAVLAGTTLLKFGVHGAGAHGLLERLLGRRQLRGELRRHHAAALDGGHQAAGDDGAGHGAAPGRPEERRLGGGLRRRRRAPGALAGGRHLRQPGACARRWCWRRSGWPGGCSVARWSASTRPSMCWTR